MSNASSNNDTSTGVCSSGASSKEMCTSCEQNKNVGLLDSNTTTTNIDAVVFGIDKMSISNTTSIRLSMCANCGKESSDSDMNTCNKCNSVKYCNAACKKKHRSKHKKQCEKRVAELHDEALFKQPPPLEDCPICMIRMPSIPMGKVYMSCCGKVICRGCVFTFQSKALLAGKEDEGNLCPFCRVPNAESDEELVGRYETRRDMNDCMATYNIGCFYNIGKYGLGPNPAKAIELWNRAGKLGCAESYCMMASAYENGRGVEKDEKKSKYYYELAAMSGIVQARHNLGVYCVQGAIEYNTGSIKYNADNVELALKHFMIAVKDGNSASLEGIKMLYSKGLATKDDYGKALRSYQACLDEVKSPQRDEAAALCNDWKYY